MKFFGLILTIFLWLHSCSAEAFNANVEYETEGYYWREFYGEVPDDAVEGGVDKNGITTYIGQVIHAAQHLNPGEIHPVFKNITYAQGGEVFTANRNFKILCSSQPEKFEWINSNVINIRYLLPRVHLVTGGYTSTYPFLLGRVVRTDRTIVGRVNFEEKYQTIAFVDNNKAIYEDLYQVLSFDDKCVS